MIKVKVKILLFFLLIFGLSLLISTLFQDKKPEQVLFEDNSSIGRIYTLSPVISSGSVALLDNQVFYPFVRVSPLTIKYSFVNFIEKINIINNQSNSLLFAEKRISELNKWGNDLPTLGALNDVNKLKDWWNKTEPNLWQIYKLEPFQSWEAVLIRYVLLIEKEIMAIQLSNNSNSNQNFISLLGYLKYNQSALETIILRSSKDNNDKQYLLDLSNKIFSYLNAKIEKIVPNFYPLQLSYSLKPLIKDKEYGIYNVLLDSSVLPTYLKTQAFLELNGVKINKDVKIIEDKFIKFSDVKIDSR